jgi:DNA-binding NarL/FixJ family response regulator
LGADAALEAPQFSGRQQEVLQLLLMGMSNKGICRALQMSESTVKTHLAAIFRKLGVNRRAEAMVAAMSLGLKLQLDGPASGLRPAAAEPGGLATLAD